MKTHSHVEVNMEVNDLNIVKKSIHRIDNDKQQQQDPAHVQFDDNESKVIRDDVRSNKETQEWLMNEDNDPAECTNRRYDISVHSSGKESGKESWNFEGPSLFDKNEFISYEMDVTADCVSVSADIPVTVVKQMYPSLVSTAGLDSDAEVDVNEDAFNSDQGRDDDTSRKRDENEYFSVSFVFEPLAASFMSTLTALEQGSSNALKSDMVLKRVWSSNVSVFYTTRYNTALLMKLLSMRKIEMNWSRGLLTASVQEVIVPS